jgi:transposase
VAADNKGAEELGAYLVFIDESGFMLTGTVCRTWAPRGRTPTFSYWYKHDKVSVISGLSVSPRQHRVGLYYQMHEANIRHPEVCHFLRHLSRHLPGPIIILWDNGAIHKGDDIREFCAQHPRLHLEYFPGYAPEWNPDEGVWDQTKKAMANGRPKDVRQLKQRVHAELRRLTRSRAHLRACFHQSDLPSFLKKG